MPDDITYVALLGPVGSGKTALIPSLQKSANNTHGLPHSISIKVSEDPQAFATEGGGTSSGRGDQVRKRKLAEASQYAFRGDQYVQDATRDNVLQYPMRIGCRRGTATDERRVSIIDAGGGLMLPKDGERRARARNASNQGGIVDQRIKSLTDMLQKDVAGIIFCIDITADDVEQWADAFKELVEDIVRNFEVRPGRPKRRIALTFTKTDQLFMLDGMNAARNALTRATMLTRLQQTFRSATRDILAQWRNLEEEEKSKIEIRCFPTSVFGYIDKNGCVNYSYSKNTWLVGDEILREALGMSALADGDGGDDHAGSLIKYWRPMLTIDPFIYAVYGDEVHKELGLPLASHYMFRLEEFLGVRDDEREDGDAGQSSDFVLGPLRFRRRK